MRENLESKTVNKDELMQLLEASPSRTFVRPEVDVTLLLQAWSHMGLYAFQEMTAKLAQTEWVSSWRAWNPRVDVTEQLSGIYDLPESGFASASELLLVGYASNLKKFESLRRVLYGVATARSLPGEVLSLLKLPPTFGEFLNSYLDSRRFSQNYFAKLAGVSQSVLSSAITGLRPIRDSFLKIVNTLDIDDVTKEVVFEAYAPRKVRTLRSAGIALPGSKSWEDDLYQLNRDNLATSGFNGVEEYLLTGFINTSRKFSWMISQVDDLPAEPPRELLEGKFRLQYIFPTVEEMNQKNRVVPVLLHAWAARGLFYARNISE